MVANPAQIYQDEFVSVLFEPWVPFLLDAVSVPPGTSVIDVGCGTGVVTRALADRVGKEGRVVGLDINPQMLAVASSTASPGEDRIEWINASADDIPFDDAAFDIALSQQSFQFFPDKEAGAAELFRVLKPGGRIGLAIWDSIQRNEMFLAMDESTMRLIGAAPFSLPFSFSDRNSIERVLAGAGFHYIDIEQRSLTVRAESGKRYINANLHGAAAVLPSMAAMNSQQIDELAERMMNDLADFIERHTIDDQFEFDTVNLIITATR